MSHNLRALLEQGSASSSVCHAAVALQLGKALGHIAGQEAEAAVLADGRPYSTASVSTILRETGAAT